MIVVVKASGLCDPCFEHCVISETPHGCVKVAVELNDLCTYCLLRAPSISTLEPTDYLAVEVSKRSPWHRRERWQRTWWGRLLLELGL